MPTPSSPSPRYFTEHRVHGAPTPEELYRLLVDSVSDYAIFALDRTGHVLTWNVGAQRIKGYAPDEIIGKHFSIFYSPEDRAAGKPQHVLETAAQEGRYMGEGWRYRKDGTRFWASVVVTALRDDTGELVGFGKVTRDLTERRAAEQRAIEDARRIATEEGARQAAEARSAELADLVERVREQAVEIDARRLEAEAANRAKSEFLATMSHELRTPLNAIGGYAQLLQLGVHGPVTPEQVTALERIQHSEQHLLGLINDVLNFARLEAGRVEYNVTSVDVADSFEAMRAMAEPQARERGITLDVVPPPPGLKVKADREKLHQVLLNLLANAVKFTPPGGHITLSAEDKGARVLLRVSDTGRGIPADQKERIFEPFVQIDPALTRTVEGTGLGLAISRDLARGMGGELRLERSKPGEGSVFAVELKKA